MEKEIAFYSTFWEEVPEKDNPFAAKEAYCHGYNVYGDMLGKASWIEYLYLLFKGVKPTERETKLLETLAVALANPGPREASVRAAINSGVSKAAHASSLICALAVGAGQYGGSHEVYLLNMAWQECGKSLDSWLNRLTKRAPREYSDIWPDEEHALGFDPNGNSLPTTIKLVSNALLKYSTPESALCWLVDNRDSLEDGVGYPLSLSGVAGATLFDLGFDEHQSTMIYLMLRLPGAAAHALEQSHLGWKKFPFFPDAVSISNDPGDKGLPTVEGVQL